MLNLKQYALGLCAALIATTSLISCSKDKDDPTPSAYPKSVTIEYRVTSPGFQKCDILYINETGGNSTIDDVDLPFSKKITRTVNYLDNASVNASVIGNGSLKAEVLVNNEVVATQTFTGTSTVGGTVVHVFK